MAGERRFFKASNHFPAHVPTTGPDSLAPSRRRWQEPDLECVLIPNDCETRTISNCAFQLNKLLLCLWKRAGSRHGAEESHIVCIPFIIIYLFRGFISNLATSVLIIPDLVCVLLRKRRPRASISPPVLPASYSLLAWEDLRPQRDLSCSPCTGEHLARFLTVSVLLHDGG